MSRLGRIPIAIPKGVELKVSPQNMLNVKGPKGNTSLELLKGIILEIIDGNAVIKVDEKSKVSSAEHGLFRALINNMIIGVDKGFKVELNLVGVGFRAQVKGNILELLVGFSHPKELEIPKDIKVTIEKSVAITIEGIDKQKVGQFAASVREVKKPEPYKGKGIRYKDEYVRKKAGKAAKAAAK
jgi:large subunit ribosomal protein L6